MYFLSYSGAFDKRFRLAAYLQLVQELGRPTGGQVAVSQYYPVAFCHAQFHRGQGFFHTLLLPQRQHIQVLPFAMRSGQVSNVRDGIFGTRNEMEWNANSVYFIRWLFPQKERNHTLSAS